MNRRGIVSIVFGGAWALSGLGCSGEDTTCVTNEAGEPSCAEEGDAISFDSTPLGERLAELRTDLSLGDSGDEVAAVQEFLTRYGYFPNGVLQAEYPAWHPIMHEAPAAGLYDGVTAEAVGALQALYGLEGTRVVDEATRALLRSPRCGVPDSFRSNDDVTEKFARNALTWANGAVTYDVVNTDDSLPLSSVLTAAANMMAVWAAETNLSITRNTAAPQITISFAALTNPNGTPDGVGNALARTGGGGFGILLQLDTAETWTLGAPSAAARAVNPVLLHELGHALGLSHSSFSSATMYGSQPSMTNTDVSLDRDDKVAISSAYDSYTQVIGAANDIGVAFLTGDTWIISKTPAGAAGNFAIQKRMPNINGVQVFQTANNGAAVRISVAPNGRPWVIAKDGTVHRRTTLAHDSGTWEQIPGPEATAGSAGCAKDIAVNGGTDNGEGIVWALGCTAAVAGGFPIYRSTVNGFVRANNGGAVRIAVSTSGVPWVVASDGTIHYRSTGAGSPPAFSTSHLAPSTWTQTTNGRALDIGVFGVDYPWVVGTDNGVYVWNRQRGNVAGNPLDQARDTWLPITVSGTATAIAVGPNEMPWIVASDGAIRKPVR